MNVQEIESAITQLPPADLAQLAAWFEEFQAQAWDKQIEEDVKSGRLDEFVKQVEEAFKTGQCRPL